MELLPSLNDFKIIKIISHGGFGTIKLAMKNSNKQLYAIKSISKNYVQTKNIIQQVFNERNALALTNCEFVVRIFYSFQTIEEVQLVMEYMPGGDLKTLLNLYGRFNNFTTRFYISEVAIALKYLHRIIHKDIKPDNILISNNGHIKLTDFGLSKLNLDHQLNINDLIYTTPLKKQNIKTSSTPINSNYIQKMKKYYIRTPGQLLSLTTKFTFSPMIEKNKKLENIKTYENLKLPLPFDNIKESIDLFDKKNILSKSFDKTPKKLSIEKNEFEINEETKLHNLSDTNIIKNFKLTLSNSFYKNINNKKEIVWGTPDYLAPEILLKNKENFQVDWWALGICFYEFLCGFPPFSDNSVDQIFKNIIDHNIVWPPINLDNSILDNSTLDNDIPKIKKEAFDIINKLLQPNPKIRANFETLKLHEYFKKVKWDSIFDSYVPFLPKNNIF